jgi:CRP/FNR family transcriptional regulator, anaerobic regulatory protein
MNVEEMFAALSSVYPISRGVKKNLEKELVSLTLPKNYHLLEAPKVQEHIYFLRTGFAMTYTYETGKKVVTQFWGPGEIVLSFTSFFDQLPSTEYIQLMEKSDLFCLSYGSLSKILTKRKNAQILFRLIMSKGYARTLRRIQDIKREKVTDRLRDLLQAHPTIEQIVSQEFIASWLGITPQSLSRIKRQKDFFNKG